MKRNRIAIKFVVIVLSVFIFNANARSELLDRIVAVVEDDVILDKELTSVFQYSR